MNNNTLLISYKTLTQSSELNENMDPNVLRPMIKEIQEMKIQPVIGTRLFEKLKADIEADTLSDDYKFLVDEYIKEALIYSILTDLPYKVNFRFSNVGVKERTSENAAVIDAKSIDKISDFYKGRAVWYTNRLNDYLKSNTSKFPEYLDNSERDEIRPKKGQYNAGIYLG